MYTQHEGFLIRKEKPWVKWIVTFVILSLLTLVFYLGQRGHNSSVEKQQLEIIELNTLVSNLQDRNDELVKKNARLYGDSIVDRDASRIAKESLIEIQQEVLDLKEELKFYQRVVDPANSAFAVNVESFVIEKVSENNLYSYKLILTKSGRTSYNIKGEVIFTLIGLLDGVNKLYQFKEVSLNEEKNHIYDFKYFQVLEGQIKLPLEFYPESVKVKVNSLTKNVKSLEVSFNWADLTLEE